MTTYQTGKTIRPCFETLLPQLDEGFEMVVVDSESTDGSLDYLRELEEQGRIRLIVQKCNRGEGRQIAVERAEGEVLVQQIDADQLYEPFLQDAAMEYEVEAQKDPDVLFVLMSEQHLEVGDRMSAPVSFVRKESFMSKTKWPPLQYGEDVFVFDVFKQEGHYKERIGEYASQVQGNLFGLVRRLVANKKEMFDSGFSFRTTLKRTRYHGLLFLLRAMTVVLAWIWYSLSKLRRS